MNLHFTKHGQGRPLVLLHGLGSLGEVWEPLFPFLEKDFTLYALDLPGYGKSASLPEGMIESIEGFSDAIQKFIERHKLSNPVVAGNSLGGAVALELGKRKIAQSVIAIAPIGFGTLTESIFNVSSLFFWNSLGKLLSPMTPLLVKSLFLRKLFFANFLRHSEKMSLETALNQARNFTWAPAFRASLKHTVRYVFKDEPPLTVPTLLIWGEKDKLIPLAQAKRAEKLLPQAKLHIIAGAGHVLMIDAPEETAKLFLNLNTSSTN